ncbi:MAG: FAD-dependent oxidoreductase [Coriobacteriales bacterium]|nr:FAD-dependent oxidoreductase [Coriobacteriales bacterium]
MSDKTEVHAGVSRREFLKGTVLATAASTGVFALSGCDAPSAQASAKETYLPEAWDQETDILVVGCGGAGIAAGITAKTEELGEVLLLEAAPQGYEGGNTRVSAQVIFIPDNVEGAIRYQRNLNGPHVVEEELIRSWAENICENLDWFKQIGVEANESTFFSPEWPDVEGSEHCKTYLVGEGMGKAQLWDALAEVANDLGVTIRHDTRVIELVYEPQTREVLGVKATTPSGEQHIKARKGVVLACGGFENDPEMIRNYYQIGYHDTRPLGTPYNKGDGIRMAQSVGAELWHMNNFANSGFGAQAGGLDNVCVSTLSLRNKDYIYVASDGRRFMYEETVGLARHGKYLYNGASTNLRQPIPIYAVFGSKTFDGDCIVQESFAAWLSIMKELLGTTNQAYLDAGVIVKGDTPEDLANKIGVNSNTLKETIESYNANAAAGQDPVFGRGTDVYSAFNYGAMEEAGKQGQSTIDSAPENKPSIAAFALEPLVAPYYAIQLHIQTLNTQGGPRRGLEGEVLDTKGKPIPRLYAAGELGSIYSYNYNGGGNVSEALSSGRLAARSIGKLESWE